MQHYIDYGVLWLKFRHKP